jgi:RNA 2',3'-cyclic 3'-phosphodiesterase
MTLRAFVAVEVPERVVDSLGEFQKEISATGADVKLVERENLHLNLKFLGEISEAQAAEVQSRLGRLSQRGGNVAVRGVGAFPSQSRPRVVWAGVAREHEALLTPIAQEVIGVLEGIGESDDRPFRAHITLGRVRSSRNLQALGELLRQNSEKEFGAFTMSEIKLKSSALTPSGPVYKDMGVFRLG